MIAAHLATIIQSHPESATTVKRRVRFNPKEIQYIIPLDDYSGETSISDNYITPYYRASLPSSTNIFATPRLTWNESYACVKANYLREHISPYHHHLNQTDTWKLGTGAPAMSPSMRSVQMVLWDVHTERQPTELDGHCATIDPNIHQLFLHSDLLLDDILVTPSPSDDCITVGRVYDAVRSTLKAQIYVSSAIYGMCGNALKRAVWEVSKSRTRENGIRTVQYMDFLLDDHIMLGVSMKADATSWELHFGRIKTYYRSLVIRNLATEHVFT